jgi:hypothetical protein
VVATGFGDPPRRRREEDPFAAHPRVDERRPPAEPEPPRRAFREPAGEPRVSRVRRPTVDLDVPEFIPRR